MQLQVGDIVRFNESRRETFCTCPICQKALRAISTRTPKQITNQSGNGVYDVSELDGTEIGVFHQDHLELDTFRDAVLKALKRKRSTG